MANHRPVRCAVIGVHNIASQHIPVLHALPEAEVVALCDVDPAPLAAASRTYGVAQVFSSVDDLLAWGEFDAAYVLVSVLAVAEVAERCMRAGFAAFIEKPPGLYTADTERLARAVRETGAIAAVGLNRRFYSSTLAGRAALLDTGDVLSVTVHADEDAGSQWHNPKFPPEVAARWIYANSIHALDLLRFFGGEVANVTPLRRRRALPNPDSFSALLEFESGAVGRAVADHFAPRGAGHRYEARTATAVLRSESGFDRVILERRGQAPVAFELTGLDRRLKPGFPGESQAFLRAVRRGEPAAFPSVTLDDAVGTMRMLDAITGAEAWAPQQRRLV